MAKSRFLLSLILCFQTHASYGKSEDKFHIYVPGSYTGILPIVAVDILGGVRFWAEEVNRNGGLLGRQVEVIPQDDRADLAVASQNAAIAMNDPNHLATIGHNFSRLALPIGKLYNQNQKLYMTPYATSTQISEIGGTVFQVCYNDAFQGKALASVAINQLKAKRIAILTNQSDLYSEGLSQHFITSLQRMPKAKDVVVKQINYLGSMMNIAELKEAIKAFKADLIFLPENKHIVAAIVRVFQASDIIGLPILGSDGWGSEAANIGMYMPEKSQKRMPTYYYTYHWLSSLKTPLNMSLYPALRKSTQAVPLGPGILAYEGLTQIEAAVKRLQTYDNVKVAAAMRGVSFEGTTGTVRFDRSGATVRNLVLVKVTKKGLEMERLVAPTALSTK